MARALALAACAALACRAPAVTGPAPIEPAPIEPAPIEPAPVSAPPVSAPPVSAPIDRAPIEPATTEAARPRARAVVLDRFSRQRTEDGCDGWAETETSEQRLQLAPGVTLVETVDRRLRTVEPAGEPWDAVTPERAARCGWQQEFYGCRRAERHETVTTSFRLQLAERRLDLGATTARTSVADPPPDGCPPAR